MGYLVIQQLVKGYGNIVAPLTRLLHKDAFVWNELNDDAIQAFEELKQAMMTILVLALLDFFLLFIIEIDASGFALGAMLTQESKPVA